MSDMATEFALRTFTVDDFHRLAEVGILRPDERVELLDGLLVQMSPIGQAHWGRHAEIVAYLSAVLGDVATVVPQGSFSLGDRSEVQPDVAILAKRRWDTARRGPTAEEIYVVVELADSSLKYDTGVKLRLYARFGIPDYLVVDLIGNVLVHYRSPNQLGYERADRPSASDTFTVQAIANIPLAASAFLDPLEAI